MSSSEEQAGSFENLGGFGQSLGAGFASGMVVTALLNPYDRALFLSVRGKRPFLVCENWTTPFQGVGQTLVSRSLSTGLFFPLEELGRSQAVSILGLDERGAATDVAAGNFAGLVNAFLLSPFAAVKYMAWGRAGSKQQTISKAAIATWRRGGLAAFFTGFGATVARDVTFGALFSFLRRRLRLFFYGHKAAYEEHKTCFCADAAAASLAAVASGPFNYARNRQFAHHSKNKSPPSVIASLLYFRHALHQRDTLYAKARYAQTRLMIGWGTLRVAAGMGLSSLCYNLLIR